MSTQDNGSILLFTRATSRQRQHEPEVIAHISTQYSADSPPEWVSVIEGDVDYREFLRSKGVVVPAADDGSSMDDAADDSDADGSGEASAEEEDIAQGTIPVQGSTTGDVDPESSTPIDSHRQPSTPINSQPPQEPSTATAKPSTMSHRQPSTGNRGRLSCLKPQS